MPRTEPSASETRSFTARHVALMLGAVLLLLSGCAMGRSSGTFAPGSAGGFPTSVGAAPEDGCGPLPPGWPELTGGEAESLLAPFLACPSPAWFLALQARVDMPRLVGALDDWSAVRLGALGPLREDATEILNHKRAAFLVTATERQGVVAAEVLALFLLHSAPDDDVDAVLRLLARDKRLAQTLGAMPVVRDELEQRGLRLSAYPERGEQAGDVLRGLGRAARDALSSTPVSDGARYLELSAMRAQLPVPYQRALDERERAWMGRHFSPDHVALGSFDALTFGVPLGLHGLVLGTGDGVRALARGEYERAARELAPAVLLVSLYAGGKALRAAPGSEATGGPGLSAPERLQVLRELARAWEERLGVEGVRQLADEIRARGEAGRFVAVGGAEAAVALHEARGDVGRAQAWLSQAREPRSSGALVGGGGTGTLLGELAAWVDEGTGLTAEVVEAKLAGAEREATGPRLSTHVAVLEVRRPLLASPPPGAEGHPRWSEYVAYYEKRLGELQRGQSAEGPLTWVSYDAMRGGFARGLAFERTMVKVLRADAARPRAQRRFLGDFERPRIETNVGVWKPDSGLRYADVLVIEEGSPTGQSPRVETLSLKSRDLSKMEYNELRARLLADAKEAWMNYGETLDIRRPSLRSVLPQGRVVVPKLRLVYEGGALSPSSVKDLHRIAQDVTTSFRRVEVVFQ
jgi:hypothetical protein